MPLELNKPRLVLRTGTKDDKLVVYVMDGDCADGITQDKPRTSLRTGTKDGKQVQLVADQKLDPDGKLIIGKPYLALRTGMKDGKQVVLVAGKYCDPCFCPDVPNTPIPTAQLLSAGGNVSFTVGGYQTDLGAWPNVGGNLPDFVGKDGWVLFYTDPVTGFAFTDCGSFYLGGELIIRRCDMQVALRWVKWTGGIETYKAGFYRQCNDPDDEVGCDPLYVRRKMNMATMNPVYLGTSIPFQLCTGAGQGCDGEEYIIIEQ